VSTVSGSHGGGPHTPGRADTSGGVIGLRVPSAIAYRHLAIRLVSTACKMALESGTASAPGSLVAVGEAQERRDADGDFEAEVVSAFGEAFNNIAVHGFRDLEPEPVQIEVDWDDEKLVITFVDRGHIFDPDAVVPPDLDELPEHGMGLFIIRSCMDSVEYQPGPPNVLRLVKLLTRSRQSRESVPPPPPTSSEQAVQESSPTWEGASLGSGSVGSVSVASAVLVDGEERSSGVDLIPSTDRVARAVGAVGARD
jgi:serine/threonine-protein kinase RsbW